MSILSITYDGGVAVTASDGTNDPAGPFAGFHTGSGGTIKVSPLQGSALTLTNVPAGVIYSLAIQRVWSTGTTATGVIGLYAPPYKRAAGVGTSA